jgi:hypothetical protein
MFKPIENRLILWLAIIAAALGWAVLLYLLSQLRAREKKALIITTTFLAGLFFVLEFFLPAQSRIFFWAKNHANPFTPLLIPLGVAVLAIWGFTFMLGVINLSIIHGRSLLRRRSGWHNSAAFFITMAAMIFFGLWQDYGSKTTPFGLTARRIYQSLFDGALVSLDATMFSLLAFYMAVAAYRAFRLRSGEATVLVVAAFLVMIGQVPVGMALTGALPAEGWLASLRTENIALWLSNVISMSGLRAVNFGIGVGALAMSLRLWLNLERGAFFEQEF